MTVPGKGGRPSKGARVPIKTRVAPVLAAALQQRASEHGVTTSEYLADLIEREMETA